METRQRNYSLKQERYESKAIRLYMECGLSGQEIASLRHELRQADLRAEEYDELINVAGSRFNIRIRNVPRPFRERGINRPRQIRGDDGRERPEGQGTDSSSPHHEIDTQP